MLHHPACADFAVWFIGILLSPIVPYSGELSGWWASGGIAYERQIRLAREKGEPVTLAELDAFYPSSPEIEQATKLWLGAIDQAETADAETRERLVTLCVVDRPRERSSPLGDDDLIDALAFVHTRDRELELVRRACDAGSVARFPVEFEKLYWAQLPHINGLRNLWKDLAIAAEVHAAEGKTSLVADDLILQLAIVRSLDNEPIMMSSVVRTGYMRMTCALTQRLLTRVAFDDRDLSRWQSAWGRIEVLAPTRRVLLGERVLLERVFMTPTAEAFDREFVGFNRWAARIDAGKTTGLLRRLIDGYGETERSAERAFDRLAADLDNLSRTPRPLVYLYAHGLQLAESIESLRMSVGYAATHVRLAVAATACERFRLKQERWPRSLEELVPAYIADVPRDPLSDGPLRYRVDSDEAVLYGVGMNGQDDGGVFKDDSVLTGDLVLRLRKQGPASKDE